MFRSFHVKDTFCHSLRGLCGLKWAIQSAGGRFLSSQPARAVWIEITHIKYIVLDSMSQPARAVWIEICIREKRIRPDEVTACEGCVD